MKHALHFSQLVVLYVCARWFEITKIRDCDDGNGDTDPIILLLL